MRAPVVIPTGAGNHASQAAAICQKSPPSRPETGKHEYLPTPKTHSRSDVWQFFTDDWKCERPSPERGMIDGRQLRSLLKLKRGKRTPKQQRWASPEYPFPLHRGETTSNGPQLSRKLQISQETDHHEP